MSRLIDNNIWNRRSFSNLTPEEKLLFLYLETSPETNYYGVFLLPVDEVIAFRTGLSLQKVKSSFESLKNNGKISLVGDYIIIFDYFDRQKNNESEKTVKGLRNFEESLPEEVLSQWVNGFVSPYEGGIKGVSSPLEESKVKESKVKESKINIVSSKLFEDDSFVQAWEAYRDHRKKKKPAMTEHAENLILKDLEEIGPSNARLAVEESLKRGWIGVFTDRFKREKKPPDKEFSNIKSTAI
jgi:hypothetical protein